PAESAELAVRQIRGNEVNKGAGAERPRKRYLKKSLLPAPERDCIEPLDQSLKRGCVDKAVVRAACSLPPCGEEEIEGGTAFGGEVAQHAWLYVLAFLNFDK